MPTALPRSLRAALTRAGFESLTDLARATGYAPQTFHAVRCGARRASSRMAQKIGRALGLPPDTAARVLVAVAHDEGEQAA